MWRVRVRVRFFVTRWRGWTRDLAQLHKGSGVGPWWIWDEVRSAEQTPAWQEDAARAADGRRVSYTEVDLAERGWTASMIDKLLDLSFQATPRSPSGTSHVWSAALIEALEAAETFTKRSAGIKD